MYSLCHILQVFSSSIAVFLCAKLVKYRLNMRALRRGEAEAEEMQHSNGVKHQETTAANYHSRDDQNGDSSGDTELRNRYNLRTATRSTISNGHI